MSNNDVSNNHSETLNETQVIESPALLQVGECLLGRFEIQALCGQGRYGCVYRAYDKQLDTQIAIKVLSYSISQQTSNIIQFKQELLHLRQLSHPNILRVHEYYFWHDLHFFTMDWIAGKSLAQCDLSSLSKAEFIKFTTQLLDALTFVQQSKIIHCDIKPDNIICGEDGRVYLSDFGLSVFNTPAVLGIVAGTPYYAAPEYLQSGQVNNTTDLYSLGVILYEACFHKLPFGSDTLDGLLVEKQLPVKVGKVKSHSLAVFKGFILKLIAAQPKARYQDAQTANAAFHNLLEGKKPVLNKLHLLIVGVFFIAMLAIIVQLITVPNIKESQHKVHYAVAVIPSSDTQEHIAFSSYINYRLHELANFRVIEQHRIKQLMTQLGLTAPLNEQKLALLADILNVDFFIAPEQIPTGLNQYDIKFAKYQLNGFKVNQEALLITDFDQQNWQTSVEQLVHKLKQEYGTQSESLLFREVTADPELLSIKSLIQHGEFDNAQTALTQFTAKQPNVAFAWFLQGELYLATNQIMAAESAYDRAISFANNNSYIGRFAVARMNDLAGKVDQAQADYLALTDAFPYDIALKLALAEFYSITEQHQNMEQVLLAVVALDPYHPDAWFMLGRTAFLQGQFQKAVDEYFVKALVTAKKSKNLYQEAEALNAFGVVYTQLGEIELAYDYYQQALAIREKIADLAGMATTLGNLSSLQLAKAHYQQAEQYLQQSINLYEQLNDQVGLSHTFNELGVLAEEQAHYQQALEYYQQGLDIRMSLGNQTLQAQSMNNIGFIYFMLLNKKHALVYWRQSEQLFQTIQNPLGIIHVRQNLGQIELAQGNWRNAFQLFNIALSDAQQLNGQVEQWVSKSYLARLAFLQGNFSSSINSLEDVYNQAKEFEDIRALAEFGVWLVDWSLQLGNKTAASQFLTHLKQDVASKGNREYQSKLAVYEDLHNGCNVTDFKNIQLVKGYSQNGLYMRQLIFCARETLRENKSIAGYLQQLATLKFELYQYQYVDYLELLAIDQARSQNWQALLATLNKADRLLRTMGGYWRGFQFDRLRIYYAQNHETDVSNHIFKLKSDLKKLLVNLPPNSQAEFVAYHNYFQFDELLPELLENE